MSGKQLNISFGSEKLNLKIHTSILIWVGLYNTWYWFTAFTSGFLIDESFFLRERHLPLFYSVNGKLWLWVTINGCSLTKTLIDLQSIVHLLIPSVYLFQFSSKLSCFPAQSISFGGWWFAWNRLTGVHKLHILTYYIIIAMLFVITLVYSWCNNKWNDFIHVELSDILSLTCIYMKMWTDFLLAPVVFICMAIVTNTHKIWPTWLFQRFWK